MEKPKPDTKPIDKGHGKSPRSSRSLSCLLTRSKITLNQHTPTLRCRAALFR
jgi:hypothetical protein